MVQSTGRCGSTLVSHAFAAADNVMSFAEPDVYYQLTSSATTMTPSSSRC